MFDLRKNIAIVPQDTALFNETAIYNIAYGAVSNYDNLPLDLKKFQNKADNPYQMYKLREMHSDEVWSQFLTEPPMGNRAASKMEEAPEFVYPTL